MLSDARMTITMDYDGDTADLTIVLIRDRGTLGNTAEVIEFACESHELTDNMWHEAFMTLMKACNAITAMKR